MGKLAVRDKAYAGFRNTESKHVTFDILTIH